jgi:hypothetical protein
MLITYISEQDASFITIRDCFYMASVSETNWPYVQHRGLQEGFLKVIDGDNTQALAPLKSTDSSAPIERGFSIHIEAFDWNCLKYITPRYTKGQIKSFIEPIQKQNAQLKQIVAQQAKNDIEKNIIENSLGDYRYLEVTKKGYSCRGITNNFRCHD